MPGFGESVAYLRNKSDMADVVTRMMLCLDSKDYVSLTEDVYALELKLDYGPLLGGKIETLSSKEWTKRLAEIYEPYDSTQHVIHNLLINHPSPGSIDPHTLKKCTAVAYAHCHFYNRTPQGIPEVFLRRQGCRYDFEFVRISVVADKNPWRLSKICCRLDWRETASTRTGAKATKSQSPSKSRGAYGSAKEYLAGFWPSPKPE